MVSPLPASPMPSPYILLWANLGLTVGVASLYSPGPERYVAPLLIFAGLVLVGSLIFKRRWLTTLGLSTIAVSGVGRAALLIYGDHLRWHSQVIGVSVWLTISAWAVMRVRSSIIAGVQWGRY